MIKKRRMMISMMYIRIFIFSDWHCREKFCMKLLVFFNVLKCKIITTLCILLLPQLFTFANSLNTLFKRGLLKFYWTAKNTMAFFLKCTHLRYPFRMHEISIGLGLESLEGREFKVNRICVGENTGTPFWCIWFNDLALQENVCIIIWCWKVPPVSI